MIFIFACPRNRSARTVVHYFSYHRLLRHTLRLLVMCALNFSFSTFYILSCLALSLTSLCSHTVYLNSFPYHFYCYLFYPQDGTLFVRPPRIYSILSPVCHPHTSIKVSEIELNSRHSKADASSLVVLSLHFLSRFYFLLF